MVWVHGSVHGDWGTSMYPFVKEAIERGYVIITPEYRGSTGYGKQFYDAIDYGGNEVGRLDVPVPTGHQTQVLSATIRTSGRAISGEVLDCELT